MPVPNTDKRKVLYDAVSKDYNVGTYEEFSQKLDNPEKRKALYTAVGESYNLGTYQDFESKINVSQKKSANENVDGSKDLLQPAKVQKQPSSNLGTDNLFVEDYVEPEAEPVQAKPKDGKVDFSKDIIDNGFFSSDNTAVRKDINIDDKERLEKERIQSEKDSLDREKYLQSVDNKIGVLKSAGNEIAQSAIHGVGENLKSIGIQAKDLDWFDEYDGMKAEELATYKAGDWLQETAKELFPTNPKFQDDFLAHTLPSATGSMLDFVGGGLATKGITKLAMKGASSAAKKQVANRLGGLTVATLGATQLAATEYQNALAENGGDHEKAMDVFYLSLPIGSLEGLPVAKFMKRLDNSSGGYVQKYLTNNSLDKITKTLSKVESTVAGKAGLGGLEEMTQEITSSALTNVAASETYDKTREIFEGAGEQGAAGFLIGAMLNGMGSSLRKKHSEAATPEEKADIQKAIDYVDTKESELKAKEDKIEQKIKESEALENTQETKVQEVYKPGDTVELSIKKNEETNSQGEATENSVSQQVPVSEEVTNVEEVKEEVKPTGIEAGLSEETKTAIDKEINFMKESVSENQELAVPDQGHIVQEPQIENPLIENNQKEPASISLSNKVADPGATQALDTNLTLPVFNTKVSEFTDALKNKKIDFSKVENSQEIIGEIEDIKLDAEVVGRAKRTKEYLEKKKRLNKEEKVELAEADELLSKVPEDYEEYSDNTLDFFSKEGELISRIYPDLYKEVSSKLENVFENIKSNEFAIVSSQGTGNLFDATNQGQNVAIVNKEANGNNPPVIPPDNTELEIGNNGEETNVSGIKKALVLDEIIEGVDLDKISEKDMHSLAERLIETGEVKPEAIVNEILKTPRALQPKEVVALIHYKATLDNKAREAYKKKTELLNSGEDIGAITAEIVETERLIENFDIVAVITASQQSLAFRLRKGMLDKDYNLVTQINKYKSVNNGVIPPEVEAKFRELDKKLKEVNEQLNEAEKRAKIAEEELALKNIRESLEREDASKKITEKIREQKRSVVKKRIEVKKAKFKNIDWLGSAENKNEGGLSSINPIIINPYKAKALIELAADYIELGAINADEVFEKLNEYIKQATKGKGVLDRKDFDELIYNQAKEFNAIPISEDENGRLRIPNSIIRQAVEQGNTTIEDVTKFIKDSIKEDYPDITDREVRDAITKYGKVANMSKDEIDIQIRKIKRVGKLISGLEDVSNKKRPLRSGLQRDKLDAEERALNKQLKEAMRDLPLDADTEARQLKTSLDAVKSRLNNQIEDLNREMETGEKSARSKGVPYDEEAKLLIEERDRVKALHDEVFGKNELTDEQRLDRAIKSTERSIAETERRIAEKDLEIKKSKPVDSSELKAARERLAKSKEVLGKLQEDAGIPAKKRLEQIKKSTEKRIDQLKEKIKNNDFSKRTPKPLIADTELIKLQAEKIKIQEEYNKAQYKNELKNRTALQKWADVGLELFSSLWRALAASFDFSAVLVQGGLLSVRHPIDAAKSMGTMFRQFASEKYQQDVVAKIKAQEWYPAMKASKLALTEIDSKYNAREEMFVSNWADVIWDSPANIIERLIGKNKFSTAWKKANLYKASNRAYTGYLNSIRVLRYLDGAKHIESQGKTFESHPEEYKAWSSYINNATGRGGLGALETSAKALSLVFFSPRKLMAGLNLFTPYTFIYFGKMPPVARKKAIMDYASALAIMTTSAILWQAAIKGSEDDDDWEEFWDTRSSDFLKPKIGNTRIDMFRGFQQQVVVMSRLIAGEFVDSHGKTTKLGERFGKDINTRKDVVTKFFSNKFTPSLAFTTKFLDQKKGTKIDWETEAIQQTLPIWIRDVNELYEDHPIEVATMLNLMVVFGLGVQTYGEKDKAKK